MTGEWLDSSELIGRQRNSNSHLLQAIDAEERLQTHNSVSGDAALLLSQCVVKAEGQQQQKTTPGAPPVS